METADATCFHCGETVPVDCTLTVNFQGTNHPVCCAGCQAVFLMISGAGLGRYYRFRQALGRKISTDMAAQKEAWQAIDDRPMLWGMPAANGNPGGRYELQLQTEGIRCAACAWLIRSQLESAPGIHAVQVDTATGFTRITWSPAIIRLSAIAASLFELGYVPHLPIASAEEEGRRHERRESLKRVAVAGLGMMQVMMFAIALYSGQASGPALGPALGMSPASHGFLSWVSLLVTFPVVVYSGRIFFSGAWTGLKAGRPGMDVPVALAIGLAFIASCYNFFAGEGQVWFDSVVMFIFFLIVGRHLELVLRHRNVQAGTALARLLPEWALRITQGEVETVPATDLAVGNLARVVPGKAFPADGIIHCGSTEVDEALLTGESSPRAKGPGDRVIAGTLNLAQAVDMEITAAGRDSTLSALARMVLSAQLSRPGDAGLPRWLVPAFVIAVLLLASGTWIYWQLVQPGVAFPAALAVLVASCPCALALALPAVHSAASHRLLLEGILLTRTDALHDLLKVDCVIFDKTGTLTEGRAQVRRAHLNPRRPDCTQGVALSRAAALEAHSSHPLARAFRHLSIEQTANEVVSHPSGGLHGYVRGHAWAIGNAHFVQLMTPGMEPQDDNSDIWLADEHDWYARFQIEDGLRRDAARAVAAVNAGGMDVRIFSGDSEAAVVFAARQLSIGQWRSRQSAADKLNGIRSVQQQGHTVLMVGDGANDAPVLAAANVSMTVQGATELANSTADFILTSPSLLALGRAFEISRMAARLIRQNLAWALAYNTAILPLAMSGMLQPWMAAVGMSSSSLLVVLNATRIARFPGSATPLISGKNA